MKRKTTAIVSALLAAVLVLTGCNPSASASSGGDSTAASMMRAMSQAVASADSGDPTVSVNGNNIDVSDFVADDGTRISGTIERDADGNIIGATLYFIDKDGTKGPKLVLETAGGSQDIIYDGSSVPASTIPVPMDAAQRFAFGGLLIGFDEALDEIEEHIEDILEYYEDRREAGTYQIDERWSDIIRGTVTVEKERGDDDMEVTAASIEHFSLPISRGGTASGSYSFTKRGDDDVRASVNMSIKGFRESEDNMTIELSDISVVAEMEEKEVRDDDMFTFTGSIGGSYSLDGDVHEASFKGTINAMDDDYFSFPEYSLTIDGENVAIGRYEKPATP